MISGLKIQAAKIIQMQIFTFLVKVELCHPLASIILSRFCFYQLFIGPIFIDSILDQDTWEV